MTSQEATAQEAQERDANIRRFQLALIEPLGLAPSLLELPGVTVVADPERAGSAICATYQIGAQTVLWCDPAIEGPVTEFLAANGPGGSTPEIFKEWARSQGHEYVGSSTMRVLPAPLTSSEDASVIALDRDRAEDRERILAFLAQCDEEDIDEADIFPDVLDPVIRCVMTSDGSGFAAYAGALPFDKAPQWWDIGILTHADYRRQGIGVAAVRAVIDGIVDAGGEPLYRYDLDNAGSAAVSNALGFVEATYLHAIRVNAT